DGAVFDRQAGIVPLLHPAAQDADLRKAGGTQGSRRGCRALVGSADEDEWSSFKSRELGQSAIELRDGNIAGGRKIAERTREFVGSPNVDDGHSFAAVEPALEILRLDPRERPAHSPDKPRQQGNRREQGKCKQTIAHPIRFAAQRGAAGVSEPSV